MYEIGTILDYEIKIRSSNTKHHIVSIGRGDFTFTSLDDMLTFLHAYISVIQKKTRKIFSEAAQVPIEGQPIESQLMDG